VVVCSASFGSLDPDPHVRHADTHTLGVLVVLGAGEGSGLRGGVLQCVADKLADYVLDVVHRFLLCGWPWRRGVTSTMNAVKSASVRI
jgi:hypothetical protein